MIKKYKPGPGWIKHRNAPVWEHISGIRIHVMGAFMFRYNIVSERDLSKKNILILRKYIKINGGNKKRGLMAFAKYRYLKKGINHVK